LSTVCKPGAARGAVRGAHACIVPEKVVRTSRGDALKEIRKGAELCVAGAPVGDGYSEVG